MENVNTKRRIAENEDNEEKRMEGKHEETRDKRRGRRKMENNRYRILEKEDVRYKTR